MKDDLAVFEEHQIQRVYDEETETWLFSVIDIVQTLTSQPITKQPESIGISLKNGKKRKKMRR